MNRDASEGTKRHGEKMAGLENKFRMSRENDAESRSRRPERQPHQGVS